MNFIKPEWIIPFDFYDELLVKYYGKYYEYTDVDYEAGCEIIVGVYVWKDRYHLSKVEAI